MRHRVINKKRVRGPQGTSCGQCRKRVRWTATIKLENGIKVPVRACDDHAAAIGINTERK